jgi:hypothetical protein
VLLLALEEDPKVFHTILKMNRMELGLNCKLVDHL